MVYIDIRYVGSWQERCRYGILIVIRSGTLNPWKQHSQFLGNLQKVIAPGIPCPWSFQRLSWAPDPQLVDRRLPLSSSLSWKGWKLSRNQILNNCQNVEHCSIFIEIYHASQPMCATSKAENYGDSYGDDSDDGSGKVMVMATTLRQECAWCWRRRPGRRPERRCEPRGRCSCSLRSSSWYFQWQYRWRWYL